MQPNHTLPTIGAALRLAELPDFIDWLVADQRDLEIQDPCYPDVLDMDWQPLAEEGRACLEQAGYTGRVGIHAAFDGLELFTFDKKIREVIRLRYRQSLEFGAVLGATHMVIHSPFISFGSGWANYTPANRRQAVIDNARAVLDDILPIAEAQQCVLVIECILDKNPLPLIDLVRAFKSDYVRLSIDTGHAYLMERNGGAPPHQWVLEAGDLLGHVHLQDLDGHSDRHWAIGDGNINWPAFFRALRHVNSRPRLVLELANSSDVWPSMAWLSERKLAR